ncbi:MAG TPA: chromate transporter [Treponemataceae bacterium]|nr:chromate transporter [Treponemataceae bacterium]HPS44809.1 chromate transporter [Treponemataceae bacterium]
MSAFREYAELFWVFFRIGAVTFGGGLAMLPILERDLAKSRSWVTLDELIDYYAIGQSTPGIIAVNVATFVGYKRKGIWGSIVTTVAIVAPSIVVITLLAMFLNNFADIVWVQKALRGINVVVAVLLISAVWSVGKKTFIDWITVAIGVASFLAMAVFNVSGVIIVLAAALLGVAIRYRPARGGKGGASDDESLGPAGIEE